MKRSYLDWHSSAMQTKWEKTMFAFQSPESNSKLKKNLKKLMLIIKRNNGVVDRLDSNIIF